MQETLSSQDKVNLNSVHKFQQQSWIVLLRLTQTLCSFFYPCNSMLHSFMHADAQAAHLTLHPAPQSPLLLPGPHKHPWEGSELQEMTASNGLLLPKRSISFHSHKPPLQKEPMTNHSCLLSFQKHPKFICVCSICVRRPKQPFAARCNIALSAPTYYWAWASTDLKAPRSPCPQVVWCSKAATPTHRLEGKNLGSKTKS